MTTFRIATRARFTTVSNATIRDDTLSFRARGVLVWLLSQPDDWTCDAAVIAGAGLEGRDAILTALKELEAAKYLVRRKAQDAETGQWKNWSDIHEQPITGVGFPGVGQPGIIRKNKKKPLNPPEQTEFGSEATDPQTPMNGGSVPEDETFEKFYKSWPNRKGKKPQTLRAWKKALKKTDVATIRAGYKKWLAYWESGTNMEYCPGPAPWLNAEQWNDEPPSSPGHRTDAQKKTAKARQLRMAGHS